MKPDEAHTLVGFLKGAFPVITEQQMEVYESSLVYEDATLASKAILDGIREWKHPPRYAEIVERIRMERRKAQIDAPRPTYEADDRPDEPTELWVKRWVVARFIVEPPDLRVFREQKGIPKGVTPKEGWMPEDTYIEEANKLTASDMRRAVIASRAGITKEMPRQ
jgi:hypothetical protein